MKKKIAKIVLSCMIVLCGCLGLSACGKNDTTAKVTSISIELVNDSYTMVDGVITKTYGGNYVLDASDFEITANFDDGSKKVLQAETDETAGYTFSSTIPAGAKTPAGEYTLTFGYTDLTETTTVTLKVEKASINTADFTWNTNSFRYDGNYHSPKVEQNLDDIVNITYGDNNQKDVCYDDASYLATATLSLVDPDNYKFVGGTTLQKEWKITVGEIEIPEILLENYTASDSPATPIIYSATLNSVSAKILQDKHISWEFEKIDDNNVSTELETSVAGTYTVNITFSYDGVGETEAEKEKDRKSYSSIPSRQLVWRINKYVIDMSSAKYMTYDDNGNYCEVAGHEFIYNGQNQKVYLEFSDEFKNKYLDYMDVTILNGEQKNIGTYTASATMNLHTGYQYNYTLSMSTCSIDWEIKPLSISDLTQEDYTFSSNSLGLEYDSENQEWNTTIVVGEGDNSFNVRLVDKFIAGTKVKYGDLLEVSYGVRNEGSSNVDSFVSVIDLDKGLNKIRVKIAPSSLHVDNVIFNEYFFDVNIVVRENYFETLTLNDNAFRVEDFSSKEKFDIDSVISFTLVSGCEFTVKLGDKTITETNGVYTIVMTEDVLNKDLVISMVGAGPNLEIFKKENFGLNGIKTLTLNNGDSISCDYAGSTNYSIQDDSTTLTIQIDEESYNRYLKNSASNLWIKYSDTSGNVMTSCFQSSSVTVDVSGIATSSDKKQIQIIYSTSGGAGSCTVLYTIVITENEGE